jgi:hypothetical protein
MLLQPHFVDLFRGRREGAALDADVVVPHKLQCGLQRLIVMIIPVLQRQIN